MNVSVLHEVLNELGSSLEALETQNAALLQFLKDQQIVTDDQLAPYLKQAGEASSVRRLATRVSLEYVIGSAAEQEQRAAKTRQEETTDKRESGQQEEEQFAPKASAHAAESQPKDNAAARATKKRQKPLSRSLTQPPRDANKKDMNKRRLQPQSPRKRRHNPTDPLPQSLRDHPSSRLLLSW